MNNKIIIPNTKAMMELGGKIADQFPQGGIVLLNGDLGAGKTTLVRGLLRHLDYEGIVKSPTYTLVEPYSLEENLSKNLSKNLDKDFDNKYKSASRAERDKVGAKRRLLEGRDYKSSKKGEVDYQNALFITLTCIVWPTRKSLSTLAGAIIGIVMHYA